MNQLKIFIIVVLVFSLAGCSRHEQDNEMSAELEKGTDESSDAATPATLPVLSENTSIQSEAYETAVDPGTASTTAVATFEAELPNFGTLENPNPEAIQKALQAAGFYTGKIDGSIGSQTKRAIRNFQAQNNLSVDGKVGPKTWKKLQAYLNLPTQ